MFIKNKRTEHGCFSVKTPDVADFMCEFRPKPPWVWGLHGRAKVKSKRRCSFPSGGFWLDCAAHISTKHPRNAKNHPPFPSQFATADGGSGWQHGDNTATISGWVRLTCRLVQTDSDLMIARTVDAAEPPGSAGLQWEFNISRSAPDRSGDHVRHHRR
jgi:hypothetical protein